MIAVTPAAPDSEGSEWHFVSEVLHSLSQPLTALHCSLELALLHDGTVAEFRHSVESALQNAQRLREQILRLRELREAEDPGDTTIPVRLDRLLMRLWEDLLPLSESVGRPLQPMSEAFLVRGNGEKLERAFSLLFELLLLAVPEQKEEIRICSHATGAGSVRVSISSPIDAFEASSRASPSNHAEPHQIDFARRTFRAAGGDLRLMNCVSGQTLWVAELPLAD